MFFPKSTNTEKSELYRERYAIFTICIRICSMNLDVWLMILDVEIIHRAEAKIRWFGVYTTLSTSHFDYSTKYSSIVCVGTLEFKFYTHDDSKRRSKGSSSSRSGFLSIINCFKLFLTAATCGDVREWNSWDFLAFCHLDLISIKEIRGEIF